MKIFKYVISIVFIAAAIFLLLLTLKIANIMDLDFSFIENNSFMTDFLSKKNDNQFLFYSFLSSIITTLFVIGFGLIGSNIEKVRIKGFTVVFVISIILLLAIVTTISIFMWVPNIATI